MKIVNLIQGSDQWHNFRKEHYPASEAAAMMSKSKFSPKSVEDLALVRNGLLEIEITDYQERIFENGHSTEAAARPILEKLIDDEFSPITAFIDIPELAKGLSASFDGITFAGDTLFEHKVWNEELANSIQNGNLDEHYIWQLEQQLLVSSAERVIFVTSDSHTIPAQNNPESFAFYSDLQTYVDPENGQKTDFYCVANNFVYFEYKAYEGRSKQLIDGWKHYESVEQNVVIESDDFAEHADVVLAGMEEIKALKDAIKKIELSIKDSKDSLIDIAKQSGLERVVGAGIEITSVVRKGSIDEKLISELLDSDKAIDDYRKKSTSSYQVKAARKGIKNSA
jgi:hypothetical protein